MKTDPGPMGIAPKLLPYAIPPLAAALLLQFLAPGLIGFAGPLRGLFFAAGIWWAGLGLAFYADLVVRLLCALAAERLATRGSFGLCCHPLFACWIFFVFPAAALLLDNWVLLVCAAALGLGVARRAREEEDWLEQSFGEEFRAYRGRTRFILPVPRQLGRLFPALVRLAVFGAALGVYSLAAYLAVIQPVMLTFGTTDDERAAVYPADDWAGAAAGGFTQAATIDAPPAAVWPWLIQVGYRRAGWYNIDAVNKLAGPDYFIDGAGSSTRIVPELQKLAVGDKIELAPGLAFEVARLEPNRLLLLLAGDRQSSATSWAFLLSDIGGGKTRLVSRFRARNAPAGPAADLAYSLIGTLGGAMLQQPAMFHGLKLRAEGRIR